MTRLVTLFGSPDKLVNQVSVICPCGKGQL